MNGNCKKEAGNGKGRKDPGIEKDGHGTVSCGNAAETALPERPEALTGYTFLTLPELNRETEDPIQQNDHIQRFCDVLGLPFNGDAAGVFERLLLKHHLFNLETDLSLEVMNYGTAQMYADHWGVHNDSEELRREYLAIGLCGSEVTQYDLGGVLEALESRWPQVGHYLLGVLECYGLCYTPRTVFGAGECFYGWEDPDSDSQIMTEADFRAYYPDWVFSTETVGFGDLPADLPADLKHVLNELNRLSASDPAYDRIDLLKLWGDVSPYGITWTKGRNEVERDPVWIAMESDYNVHMNSDGYNPCAAFFEFLLNDPDGCRRTFAALEHFLDYFHRYEELLNILQSYRTEVPA